VLHDGRVARVYLQQPTLVLHVGLVSRRPFTSVSWQAGLAQQAPPAGNSRLQQTCLRSARDAQHTDRVNSGRRRRRPLSSPFADLAASIFHPVEHRQSDRSRSRQDCRLIREAVWTRKSNSMNRDDASYKLSHVWAKLLLTDVRNRKSILVTAADQRSKRRH